MATNWMLVSSPENFERAREMGFPVLAMKSRHLKKAQKVEPGDRVVYYATGVMAFAGTFTVTGPFFESHDPLFKSKKEGEDYPYRFPVRADVTPARDAFVPALSLRPVLEHTKRWPVDHWTLAFQGNVHVLSDADFATIEDAIRLGNTTALLQLQH
jgi:hypothetical protein